MLYIILGILVSVVLALFWLIFGMKKEMENGSNSDKTAAIMERLTILSEQNREIRHTMDAKLSEAHKTSQEQINQTIRTVQGISGQSSRLISEVTEKLAKLDETNKQVINFSSQLQNLQDILQNPKRRGILGEYYLETVLKNVLPPAIYQMQYSLGKDDEGKELIVDAVIFVQDKIIPIDSKFSLENYNRILKCTDEVEKEKLEKYFKQDLKNRIDETSKYIQPKKNTMNFALMFIPSETIYYDLNMGTAGVSTADLIEYAGRKKVSIVSPNSFYAFLQTILLGLNQMKVAKDTQEIIKRVQNLGSHVQKYENFMAKLGSNLSNTVGSYESARKEFIKIDKDVMKIGGEERELIETVEVEKPKDEYEA
jgi:DNA recombination protein RmuC